MKAGAMKKAVAILVAVVLIMAPLSTAFAASSAVEDLLIDLVWQTLKAWGISIVEQVGGELTENVRYWLNGELESYFIDELYEGFEQWITGIDWVYDNYGRRLLNNNGLQKFYEFGQWLKLKYSLVDNNYQLIRYPVTTLEGYVSYQLPIRVQTTKSSVNTREFTVFSASTPVYAILTDYDNNSQNNGRIYFWSENPSQVVVDTYNLAGVHQSTGNPWSLNIQANGLYAYYSTGTSFNVSPTGGLHDSWYSYTVYNSSNVRDVFQTSGEDEIDVTTDTIAIDTKSIVFPPQDPSYTDGDAIIYYSDGTIAYVDIEWPSMISVDNLPAIVSSAGTQDPGFSQVFLPLRAFVNTFSDGISVMTNIIYRLPTPAIACFYAILSITVIFGALHMFKEH